MNERRVGAEAKNSKIGDRSPKKELAKLKEQYDAIVYKISKGVETPLGPVYELKLGAAGETPLLYNTGEERIKLPKSFCFEIHTSIINAMFNSGDMEGLGILGEDHMLVLAAFDHKEKKCAIEAAEILVSRRTITSEDLNIIAETKHPEVKDIINKARLKIDEWPE